MVCAPIQSKIPSLKPGDYLSIQAYKPCSISHLYVMEPRLRLERFPPQTFLQPQRRICVSSVAQMPSLSPFHQLDMTDTFHKARIWTCDLKDLWQRQRKYAYFSTNCCSLLGPKIKKKVELFSTGYKRVRQFSLPAETVRHIWLPPRLSAISFFLPRLLCLVNSFLQRLSVWFSFLPGVSAGSRVTRTFSAGSHFSWMVVSAGRKRSWTVLVEAKYDGSLYRKPKVADSYIPCEV